MLRCKSRVFKFGPSGTALVGLTLLSGLGSPGWAIAQSSSGVPASPPRSTQTDDRDSVTEVVVPDRYGAAATDIKPERQLTPAEIETYGVSTLGDLLGALQPDTESIQAGASDTGPALLINGRRVASPNELMHIPIEAVIRVEILPEAVALQYGFGPGRKVVNVVLRPHYLAETAEAVGGASTEGGGEQGQAEADLVRLRGDAITNLNISYRAAAAISEAERNVVPVSPSAPFSLAGNVTSIVPGAEIDPALSALVGAPVTVAGVPAAAVLGAPTLAEFVPTAGVATVTDTRPDTTLSAGTSQFLASGVVSKPIGAVGVVSVTAGFDATSSVQLQGLPGVSLTVPTGNPFSPFGRDVILDRYTDALGPLTQRSSSWTGRLGLGFQGNVGPWSLVLNGLMTYADHSTTTDRGVDAAPLQNALNAQSPTFNPFASWPAPLVNPLPREESSAQSTTLNGILLANGPLFKLPAGQATAAIAVTEVAAWQSASSGIAGAVVRSSTFQTNTVGQFTINLPLTSRARHIASRLGDLSLSLTPGVRFVSGYGGVGQFSAALNWTPLSPVTVLISENVFQQPPTVGQLRGPTVSTPNVTYFDYVTGQTALVTVVSGANPSLQTATQHSTAFSISFSPLPRQPLRLTAQLAINRTDNPISPLPQVSAQIEAAFPDRFIRGPGGELVEVDTTPLNFNRDQQEILRWGFSYSRSLGPPPKPTQRSIPPGAGLVPGLARRPPAPAPNFQLSVYEDIHLQDQLLLRAGGPVFDRLSGATGAIPRVDIVAQAGVTMHNIGAHVDATWKGGYFVDGSGGDPATLLRFSPVMNVDLKIFAELGQMSSLVRRWPILSDTRVTATVDDLFDERQRVVDGDGTTPIGYQPAFINARGRAITLGLRKVF